jgi:hypothetical protein
MDPVLMGLVLDRRRLLRQLAHVLRRVGPNHPQRATINTKRRRQRLELKHAIRNVELRIAARCDRLVFPNDYSEEQR